MNIQEIENLKNKIETTNQQLIATRTQISMARKRQDEILAEYNCKDISELENLLNSKTAELDLLVKSAKQYLEKVSPIIEKVNEITKVAF